MRKENGNIEHRSNFKLLIIIRNEWSHDLSINVLLKKLIARNVLLYSAREVYKFEYYHVFEWK